MGVESVVLADNAAVVVSSLVAGDSVHSFSFSAVGVDGFVGAYNNANRFLSELATASRISGKVTLRDLSLRQESWRGVGVGISLLFLECMVMGEGGGGTYHVGDVGVALGVYLQAFFFGCMAEE